MIIAEYFRRQRFAVLNETQSKPPSCVGYPRQGDEL